MSATEFSQQFRDAVSSVFNAEQFEKLTARAFADASVNLEIELREERIAPYLVDITKPLAEVKPLISIGGKAVCSAGNISAVVGEAKSKKTFLTTALVASAIAYPYPDSEAFENVSNDISLKVLWLDTEQGEAHVRKVIDRINRITGTNRTGGVEDPRLRVFALREIDPKHRLDVLRDALYTFGPDLVVIDGVADLQYDTNDLRESDALVGELMALSTTYNCHILCVCTVAAGTEIVVALTYIVMTGSTLAALHARKQREYCHILSNQSGISVGTSLNNSSGKLMTGDQRIVISTAHHNTANIRAAYATGCYLYQDLTGLRHGNRSLLQYHVCIFF